MGIPDKLTCGQQGDGQLNTGKMVGSSRLSLQCLLHQRSNSTGQDSLNTATVPFQITLAMLASTNGPHRKPGITGGGANPPNSSLRGQIISSSDSIVATPRYDGHELCPGGSCGSLVTIVGFLV